MAKLPNAVFLVDRAEDGPRILAALEQVRAGAVPMALFQKISRIRRALGPFLEDFTEAKNELVRRHSGGGTEINPASPGFPAFLEEFQALLALQFEVSDSLVITPDDLAALPLVPGGALSRVGPLFKEDEG